MKSIALLFSLAVLFVTFSVPAAEPSQHIAELQAGLAELGYDPGPLDGLPGQKTREAIMAFQKDQELTVDGEYSDILSMLVESERERAPLLAMSDDELTKLLDGASEREVGRLLDLVPERVADFPISLTLGKSLPPDGTGLPESNERNGHVYGQWPQLAEELAHAVGAHRAVLHPRTTSV